MGTVVCNGGGVNAQIGLNCVISPQAKLGNGVVIRHNCIIEEDVRLEDGVYIDSNCIIRAGTVIGEKSLIEANCVIGEYQMDFCRSRLKQLHTLYIGKNALIRSGTCIYTGSRIGENFQTGHHVTVREDAEIGDHVSLGTLCDVQGLCRIGNYVRLHSNVHIGQHSDIDDYVWIFPYVVLTNDPTPPSDHLIGVKIRSFAVVATGAVLLPGIEIGQDALVGAGAVVTKSVQAYMVAVGNPAKEIADVRKIKNKVTGEAAYPWRYHYRRNMPWETTGFESWYASLTGKERSEILKSGGL